MLRFSDIIHDIDFDSILNTVLDPEKYNGAFVDVDGKILAKSRNFDEICTQESCQIPDIPENTNYTKDTCQSHIHRIIIPLRARKHLIGYVLICGATETDHDEDEFIDLVSRFFVKNVNWEIERMDLNHNLVNRCKELELLYEVSRVFNSIFDVREAAETILTKVTDVLQATKGSIMLLDDDNYLTIFASKGIPDYIVNKTHVKLGESISGKVAKTGEPMMSNQIEDEKYYKEKAFKQYERSNFISLPISLPLEDGTQKVVGVMNLNDKLNDFDRDDLKLATAIVSQAAFSIENAKNYQKIFQEKKKLDTAIKGMADGVVVTDSNHIVVLSNETANTILQISKEDIVGKNIFSLMQDFVLSMPPEDITISKTRTVHYEVTGSGPEYRVYSVKETKIMEGANRIVNIIMVFRDITERKKQDVLKTEFLSLISHKLRTPLVGVIGYPQFLLDGSMGELNEMQRQAIKSIEDQGNYLNDLVGQLLKFAELESKSLSIAKEPYELHILAGGIIEFMRKTADDKNIEIVVNVPKNLPPVFINPERIGEVLINLVDNAIKFTEADASKKVWIKAFRKNDDFIQMSVIDEGVGIKEKNIDKIFDRFYQSEEYFTGQVKGAGLGLAMVKHLVEHHGGTIWVESQEGVGSKFHFTLPIVLEETVSNEKNLYL